MAYQSLLVLISVGLVVLALPTWGIWPLVLVGLAPVFLAIQHTQLSPKKAGVLGLIFGTTLSLFFHSWILSLEFWVGWPIAATTWLVFALYLGLVYSAIFVGIRFSLRWTPLWIGAPVIWILGEWIKSAIPLGNQGANLGYALINCPPLVQLASVGGVPILTFGIVMINATIAYSVHHRQKKWLAFPAIGLTVWALIGIGLAHYYDVVSSRSKSILVAFIQGNHPQTEKQDSALYSSIWKYYLAQTQGLSARSPQIVFWPETVVPVPILDLPSVKTDLKAISDETQIGIVGGLPRSVGTQYANSIIAIDPYHSDIQFYDKHHLMPFGEYLPFRSTFENIPALKSITGMLDYMRGTTTQPVVVQHIPIANALCLESLDPETFKTQVKNGGQLLFVAANNAWYGKSSAAEKHFAMSRMRAIENHRFLIQASNTGISGIVDPNGKVITSTQLDTRVTNLGTVNALTVRTVYSRF